VKSNGENIKNDHNKISVIFECERNSH